MAINTNNLIDSYQNRLPAESLRSRGDSNKPYGNANTRSFEAILEQKKVQAITLIRIR